YELLRRWLEDGAPEPSDKDPIVTKLEVTPARRLMAPGEQQQITVRAAWGGAKAETVDVTPWAQYDSLNPSIAEVNAAGLITARAAGETHVMIRYCGQVGVV